MARRVQAGFAWVPSRPAFVRHLHVSPPRWNPPERDEALFVREDTPYLGSTTFSLVMGQELLVEATPAPGSTIQKPGQIVDVDLEGPAE